MTSGIPSSIHSGNRRILRRASGSAALALLFVLGACSPVDGWRNLTGASKNDPNPATTPNTKNLAAGAAAPYPNLATVPPPPTEELTAAQLQHLTQSLVADRANARYADQQLRAAPVTAEVPPSAAAPPTPTGAAPAAPPQAAGAAPGAVTLGATPPSAARLRVAARTPPPSPPPTDTSAVAAPGPAPSAGAEIGAAKPGGPAVAATPAAPANADLPAGMESGLRKPGERPQRGPMESRLVPPQIPETPQPEQPQPAPARAHVVAALPATTGGNHAHPPAPMPPTAVYSPPPPPVLASPEPTRTAMAASAGVKPSAHAAAATPIADITFAAGAKTFADADRAAIDRVSALYRQKPGKLRIVGYAGIGAGDPLKSFRTALDHAQAVAAALAKSGVPADKIVVEAAPAKTTSEGNHAEVLLEH
jgi:outer membrane protein OmpA-like peptidoglycan-associated protein